LTSSFFVIVSCRFWSLVSRKSSTNQRQSESSYRECVFICSQNTFNFIATVLNHDIHEKKHPAEAGC